MKMILSPCTVKTSGGPLVDHETGIECKILGHRQHQLVVGVLVPAENPSPKRYATGEPFSSKGGFSSCSESSKEANDGSFHRELQEKDAAFLKRINEGDTIFRAKLAEGNKTSMGQL